MDCTLVGKGGATVTAVETHTSKGWKTRAGFYSVTSTLSSPDEVSTPLPGSRA